MLRGPSCHRPHSGTAFMEDRQEVKGQFDRQYLTPSEEKALVDYVLRVAAQRMPSERNARIGSPSNDLRHVAGENFLERPKTRPYWLPT
jgi:hypothetical protein